MQLINDRIAAAGLFIVALTAWGSNVFGSQAYMLNCVGLAVLAFMTRDKILIAFGCYCALWFAGIQIAEAKGWMPQDSMVQAIDVLTLFMAAYALYVIIKHGSASKRFWFNSICVLTILLSVIGIIQYFKIGTATATLNCTNYLAAFIAIAAPLFYRKKWWLCLPLILYALWLTHTSTAIVALCVGTGFYLWKWKGAVIGFIPGLFYFAYFKAPDSLLLRVDYWTDAFNKISNHWYTLVFGTGPSILWQTDNLLHSEPVYFLWNFGIIGLLLAAAYVIRTFAQAAWPYYQVADRRLFAAFIIIIVDSFGNHLFHIASTAYLSVAILALNDRGTA